MTPMTQDQQDALQAAAERVVAKLRDVHDGLPTEEQLALHIALGHGASAGADVTGYAASTGAGGLAGSGAVNPLLAWTCTCRTPWDPRLPVVGTR